MYSNPLIAIQNFISNVICSVQRYCSNPLKSNTSTVTRFNPQKITSRYHSIEVHRKNDALVVVDCRSFMRY
jgi:hypothetical protein